MTRYAEHVNDRQTPQTTRARADQVQNSAGGFVFAVDKWTRLDRFLVLGSEGGTYYVDERKLTVDNAKCLRECLAEDGERVVRRIVEISDAGRAPKNDPAIFALAMAAGDKSPKTAAAALAALPKVCRIGTHLFHFVNDVQNFRGWGRALRRAVAAWYTERSVEHLAMQLVKYQQRDGWSHRDVLRLAHPTAHDGPNRYERNAALRWAAGGDEAIDGVHAKRVASLGSAGVPRHYGVMRESLPTLIQAFQKIHAPGTTSAQAVALIREHKLPHECVPNELKNDPYVWAAMLPHMGVTAIIRNLGKMTSVGLLKPMSEAARTVASTLTDTTKLFAARVHPIAVLLALKTYAAGHGLKGSLTWAPVREVIDALDEAFYLSFQAIEPTGKCTLLALDISGSMASSMIAGTSLSCREASAAMAMVTARTEEHWHVLGFGHRFEPLNISPRQRLDDVVRTISDLPFQGTDCALPMLWADREKIGVDTFVVWTDNETWHGHIHPHQALQAYRNNSGIDAKLAVIGMAATEFSIAATDDAGMLDIVGFDAAAPQILADFSAAREVRS